MMIEPLAYGVLIWEYSARSIPWIPTWQGLDVFQKSLHPYVFDESSLSKGRVKTSLWRPVSIHRSERSAIWAWWRGMTLTRFLNIRFWRQVFVSRRERNGIRNWWKKTWPQLATLASDLQGWCVFLWEKGVVSESGEEEWPSSLP